MSGNVCEFCVDTYYSDFYRKRRVKNPHNKESSSFVVVRYGNWDSDAFKCRVENRGYTNGSDGKSRIGFRLAIDAEKE